MYLIVDVESTCWEQNDPLKGESEIIEIGAILVSDSFEIVAEWQVFVTPKNHSILSDYCKKLTGIRQFDVASSISSLFFPKAIKALEKWAKDVSGKEMNELVFCSWGYYDKKMFEKECKRYNIEYPFETHISLKHEFARRNGRKPLGMTKVLKVLGIKLEGSHHRALDDVKNIAKIFIKERDSII